MTDVEIMMDDVVGVGQKQAKYKIKDCVFSDFFSMPDNLLQLYQTLHPEDVGVTVEDLKDVTIQNVFVNDIYNDLGFRVGERLVILVEAMSSWSLNIIIRILLYLASTYQRYINKNELDVYSSTKIHVPKPELYVLYIGDRKGRPEEISFSEEFFDGEPLQVDIKVKMLYGTGEADVISQYAAYAAVYDEQRKKLGRTREAIVETIRICKERDIMKEYFKQREQEVITMMMTLYDEEQIRKNHEAQLVRETTQQVTQKVTQQVTETEQQKAVKAVVGALKRANGSRTDAVEAIVSEYGYSVQQAENEVKKYW